LGLWSFQSSTPACMEIRVYPNLLTERKNLAALFLNRGSFGVHVQRQVGQGRDFEKLREYIPGDGYDEIHWKATAKRGHPVTKVFKMERTQEIYVITDASRLSARPTSAAATKHDPQILTGTATAAPAEEAEARASGSDLGTFSSQSSETTLERFITAALVLGLAAERQGGVFGVVRCSG